MWPTEKWKIRSRMLWLKFMGILRRNINYNCWLNYLLLLINNEINNEQQRYSKLRIKKPKNERK